MITVVGIAGHSRAGKDALATELVARHGFLRVGFGDAIKEEALTHFPWMLKNLWHLSRGSGTCSMCGPDPTPDQLRHFVWVEKPPLVVSLLQDLGDLRRAEDPLYWVRLWQRRVDALPMALGQADVRVVAPDVRNEREAFALKAYSSICVLALRSGKNGDGHGTEAFADSDYAWDAVLANDEALEAWRAKAGFLAKLAEAQR